MSDRCGEWSGSHVDLATGEVHGGAIWCKSWDCDHCAPIRQKQLMAQAVQGEPTKFITLTHRKLPKDFSRAEAAQRIVHAWRMVLQRGKREGIIGDCQYIAVFEQHKSGWPHLHILARTEFIPQKWLSERMAEYIDSPHVDIREVKSKARAAWYIAKYTAKAPEKFAGCKRYWRTLSYALDPRKRSKALHDQFQSFFSMEHVQSLGALYEKHNYIVTWESENSFTAMPVEIDFHAAAREKYRRRSMGRYKDKLS